MKKALHKQDFLRATGKRHKERFKMPQMDWLENPMDRCDLMAEWLYREFSYEYAQQTLVSWQQEFAEGQRDGRWKCLIAIEHGQLPDGASLASNDLSEQPELGPWLACVLVARAHGVEE